MKQLTSYITQKRKLIEKSIEDAIDTKSADEINIPLFKIALEKLADFAVGGKMMRGTFVLLSSEMFGADSKKLIDIASAVELAHSGLLIHDDIIDDDELRRGKRTVFAEFAAGHSKFYGQSMAICTGDIAFFLANELISNSKIDDDKKSKILNHFSTELIRVGAAEMEDFHFGATNDDPSVEKILNMYRLKSARYTFSLPFVIGAIAAGQNKTTIGLLCDFGEKLGIVFQIVDDALGVTGDSNITGKPVGNDIRQNKKTLFRKLMYNNANSSQEKTLDSLFGKSSISQKDVDTIVRLSTELGVEQEINEIVVRLSNDAKSTLNKLKISDKYKEILLELIDFNLNRNK